MQKHCGFFSILLILLLLTGGLLYRNWNIRVLDTLETPACTVLNVRQAPFLFVDARRQFQAADDIKIIEALIWTEHLTPVLALPSTTTASSTTYQIHLKSGEPGLFHVNEQQRDQACGLSTIFIGSSETIRQTDSAKWTEQTMNVSDPDSSGYSSMVIWTIDNDQTLIVIELPDILSDQIRPAAEKTFLKLAS